jgi:hypothetical protein
MAKIQIDENRSDERYLVQDLAVFDGRSNRLIGKVLNLSLSGMLVSHEEAIQVDMVIPVKLRHILNTYSDFEGKAKVKWSRQNDISGLFGTGLEFLDNSPEQRSEIQKVVNTYAVRGI